LKNRPLNVELSCRTVEFVLLRMPNSFDANEYVPPRLIDWSLAFT